MTSEQLAEVVADSIREALAPLGERLARLEARADMLTAADRAVNDTLATVRRDASASGERLAAVEAAQRPSGPGAR